MENFGKQSKVMSILRKLDRFSIGMAAFLLGSFWGHTYLSSSNDKRTCEALQQGEAIQVNPDNLPAKNSIEALEAECARQGVQLTRENTAKSILESIQNGVDVPRPLVEDARAIVAKSPLNGTEK